ncbi:putative FBD-associated F-box protein At5g56700 isoform X2 [Prunus avium]|uniref:FBD-associated F-box protein At5g56700 isoform X2 n=1 Tax=Prunus avium TaxID=42229 RepID=A0A6P5RDE1_PRUAV|nr:putative FBD-associated F-box protein At5g56700 isoform X2 [Prunus avium]
MEDYGVEEVQSREDVFITSQLQKPMVSSRGEPATAMNSKQLNLSRNGDESIQPEQSSSCRNWTVNGANGVKEESSLDIDPAACKGDTFCNTSEKGIVQSNASTTDEMSGVSKQDNSNERLANYNSPPPALEQSNGRTNLKNSSGLSPTPSRPDELLSSTVRFDRILDLPDGIPWKIVSHLSANDKMSTTCLSKEWQTFWRLGSSDDYFAASESAFWKDVNEELNHTSLLSFKLRCSKYATLKQLEDFIHAVIKKMVVVLDISVVRHENSEFSLPLEVFQSIDIKVLKIGRGLIIDIPPETYPRLHKIHVDISRPLHPSILGFYNRCPMLQELRIEGSVVEQPSRKQTFLVNSVSLKRLVIRLNLKKGRDPHNGRDVYWSAVNRYEFHIHAPGLKFLDIDETVFATFEINELPILQEARFNSGFFEARDYLSDKELGDLSSRVFSTFTMVASMSKSIIVRDGCLEALGFMFKRMCYSVNEMAAVNSFATRFLPIPVTRTISLEIGHNYAWDFLPCMLSATPHLKILKLRMVRRKDVEGNINFAWNSRSRIMPICLMDSVEDIELHGFSGGEVDMILAYIKHVAGKDRFKALSKRINLF